VDLLFPRPGRVHHRSTGLTGFRHKGAGTKERRRPLLVWPGWDNDCTHGGCNFTQLGTHSRGAVVSSLRARSSSLAVPRFGRHSEAPSSSPELPVRSVPSLDELRAWTHEPDRRVVIPAVDWSFYEQLVNSIPEGVNIHADYDGKDIEIMALGPFHDGVKKRLGRFVELTAEELEVPCTGFGSTTWKRPEVSSGVEADDCYYSLPEKLEIAAAAMMRSSTNVAE
jgi:hypothetical protein